MTLTTIDSLDVAPIGSIWETETGNRWRVVAHYGERVKLLREGTKADFYTWHISTLTPAKRIA